jgi:integrase/recombinase XerD
MKIERETKAFRTHLERLGYSKSSIYMLPNCLKEFLEFTSKELITIEAKDITNYHEYLKERPRKRGSGGLSESYINHHIYSLKLFFGWQQEKGAITENPISSLEFKAPVSKPREILTQEEIKLLFEGCESLKERAVLALFYGCGLRRSEGEKLNLKDIHFRSNILYVREGKGNKRRAVPLSPKVKEELWNYATKERETRENETAFITNRIRKRATGSSYNKILKTILERTGIKKEITLHCLRHSIATHLLESGLSVEYVRDFLGHKHLESTQIYTRIKNKQLWNLNSI